MSFDLFSTAVLHTVPVSGWEWEKALSPEGGSGQCRMLLWRISFCWCIFWIWFCWKRSCLFTFNYTFKKPPPMTSALRCFRLLKWSGKEHTHTHNYSSINPLIPEVTLVFLVLAELGDCLLQQWISSDGLWFLCAHVFVWEILFVWLWCWLWLWSLFGGLWGRSGVGDVWLCLSLMGIAGFLRQF